MTAKQHEVYLLVAEGRSAKEIAWRLGITDSAVVQRIEAVRSRAGSPPRAELARAYRRYIAGHENVGGPSGDGERNSAVQQIVVPGPFADHQQIDCPSEAEAPMRASGFIVPAAFVGPNAGLNRIAAMVVIAAGLLAATMVCLGVMQGLAALA
jgi:DNA-binding CsgD family transcriptional regulator